MQSALDMAVRAPAWAGFALMGLAALVFVLGRHGQRPVNAVMLGGAAFTFAFLGLRGVLHAWLPGAAAVIAAVLGALFGFVADGWGTAFLVAAAFGAMAGIAAQALKLAWPPIAAVAGSAGLFVGMTRHQRLSIVLPPLFAAAFSALGAAIAWGPNWRGAALWQLNDVDWVLALAAALALPLLALSLQRDRRRRQRQAARTREMDDEELERKLAARRAAEPEEPPQA